MKILHLSDTHGCHRQLVDLPPADVLVHSGDFTMAGSEQEVMDFMEWFCDLPYLHKLLIAGNHDDCLYGACLEGLDRNVHYLCHSSVVIEGVRFYGVPMFMEDCLTDQQVQHYKAIPEDTKVLITHCPPYGILDEDGGIHYGSRELLAKVNQIRPSLHLFGHIHKQHHIVSRLSTTFSSAAIVDEKYQFLNRPVVLEL